MKKLGLLLLIFVLAVSLCVQQPSGGEGEAGAGGAPLLAKITGCGTITESSVLANGIATTASCLKIQANDVVLECAGFKISLSGTSPGFAIYVEKMKNVTIKNCKIENFDYGIDVFRAEDVVLEGNSISNARKQGMHIIDSLRTILKNNVILNGGDAIFLSNSSASEIKNNKVSDNRNGIVVELSDDIVISENNACENSDFDIKCDRRASGSGNKVKIAACYGIVIEQCVE